MDVGKVWGRALLAAGTLLTIAVSIPAHASDTTGPLDTEPVVLTGAQFPAWSAGPEITARAPGLPTDYEVTNSQQLLPAPLQSDCYDSANKPDVNGYTDPDHGDHNCFQANQLPVRTLPGRTGVNAASLRGYAW